MRNKLIMLVLIIAAVLMFGAVAGFSDWRDRTDDIVGYNVLAERVFAGYAESKPYLLENMVYFPLKTTSGAIVQVQMGPRDFVEHANFKLSPRDMTTVIGMPTVMNTRHIVLAREIKGPSGVLIVRDSMGVPMWDKPPQMDPEQQKLPWEICDASR
jgi:hypothetical protein